MANYSRSGLSNRLLVPNAPSDFADFATGLVSANQVIRSTGPVVFSATTAQQFFDSGQKIGLSAAVFNNPSVMNNYLICASNLCSKTVRFSIWKKPPGDTSRRNMQFDPLAHPMFTNFVLAQGMTFELYIPTDIRFVFSSSRPAGTSQLLDNDLKVVRAYDIAAFQGVFTFRYNPGNQTEDVNFSNDMSCALNTVRIYNTVPQKDLFITVFIGGKQLHKALVIRSTSQAAEIIYDQVYYAFLTEENATGEIVYSGRQPICITPGEIVLAFDTDQTPNQVVLRKARIESVAAPISSIRGNN